MLNSSRSHRPDHPGLSDRVVGIIKGWWERVPSRHKAISDDLRRHHYSGRQTQPSMASDRVPSTRAVSAVIYHKCQPCAAFAGLLVANNRLGVWCPDAPVVEAYFLARFAVFGKS